MARTTLTADEQILAARHDAAMLTHGTYGIIEISGTDALDLLHRLSTNELRNLSAGECRGTVLTTDKGRILDYVHLAKTEHKLFMLSSSGLEQTVVDWIAKYTIMEDVQLTIATSRVNQISLVGPNSLACINSAVSLLLVPWGCTEFIVDGKVALAMCTKEFETTSICIISQSDEQISFAELTGLSTISPDSYETFRIMQGIPLARHELREEFNPFETGLSDAISFSKGCYIGQEVIARLDTYQKIQKRLVGLRMSSVPDPGSFVPLAYYGNEVGWLTSVAPQTHIGGRFGLGVLRTQVGIGEYVTYGEPGATSSAMVTNLPILTTEDTL